MTSVGVQRVRTGVFIDGSNLFWGAKRSSFFIDYAKLKKYLADHYKVSFFNFYGCEDINPSNDLYRTKAASQQKFYQRLNGMGFDVKLKPLKYMRDGTTKGDMDVNIATDLRNYENDVECLIFFTGDSDFLSLVEQYWTLGKYIRIFSYRDFLSWELKEFAIKKPRCSYKCLEDIRGEIEYVKPPPLVHTEPH